MGYAHCTPKEKKKKHLTHKKRLHTEALLKKRKAAKEIAQMLGCSGTTRTKS